MNHCHLLWKRDGSNFRQWRVVFQNVQSGEEHIKWTKIILIELFFSQEHMNLLKKVRKKSHGKWIGLPPSILMLRHPVSQDRMNSMPMIFGTWPLVWEDSWDFSLDGASSAYSSHLLICSERCLICVIGKINRYLVELIS